MAGSDPDNLPLVQRLAWSYAPAAAREAVLTLLLLDNRLAGILRQHGEVIITQLKLAWWRDRLGEDPCAWPVGEPLLARLARWPAPPPKLLALVNGWEALLAEALELAAVEEFAEGRAQGWAALARPGEQDVVLRAGRDWALADLALHLPEGEERQLVLALLPDAATGALRLPRDLRPLTVLRGLSLRALQRSSREPLDGPGAMLATLRLGLWGG